MEVTINKDYEINSDPSLNIVHGHCNSSVDIIHGDFSSAVDQVLTAAQISSDKKVCLTCGSEGATISTFTRIGKSRANPEPLINLLCCILKKPIVEVQLPSHVVCEKCFKHFEYIERLQYQLSEACRDVIKSFSKAVKIFMKCDFLQYEEKQGLLVFNDIGLEGNESSIIAKAVSMASSKRKNRDTDIKTERKHQCTLCGKAFRAYSHKVEHMVTHTQEKSFKCDICGFHTATKSNLNKHKQQHTDDYICSICDKKLCSKFSLKEHMAIHNNKRDFQCEYCEKRFLRQRDKKIHEKNHLVEFESHECEICGKRFVLKSRLARHMLVHCKEKQHICSVCDKRFARKDDLKCHERIHSGDKPYSCSECGKQFRFLSNCRNHMKCHTKETKAYHCTCCNVSFVIEAKYKNHLKTRNHRRKSSEVPPIEQIYCDICKVLFTLPDYTLHRPGCEKKVREVEISFENFEQLSEHTFSC
ncbi:zinc finger protein 586-like [Macrobrachium rosenbergii]|uniref:zinc finger protein 586-like n=1 Tax=Macrobrachium rosenbergii TaxID=79674 RepID=UPI0034D3FB39